MLTPGEMASAIAEIADRQKVVVIMSGIPGAGKTTFAHALVRALDDLGILAAKLGRDTVRQILAICPVPGAKTVGTQEQEDRVTRVELSQLHALAMDCDVIVEESTNLTDRVEVLLGFAREWSAEVVRVDMDTPLEECVRRDALRAPGDRVGRAVIERIAAGATDLAIAPDGSVRDV